VDDLDERRFAATLRWLYTRSPSAVRCQIVGVKTDAIVAHYGAMPMEYRIFDRTFLAGCASNLVIEAEHRAGMLFLSLQGHFLRDYPKKGIDFVYGLITRTNVLEPHRRMGWRSIGALPVYVKPYRFTRLAAQWLKHPALRAIAYVPLKALEFGWRLVGYSAQRDIRVDRVASFGDDIEPFADIFARIVKIAATRTRRILNWRFAEFPERDYEMFVARRKNTIVGYAVTRRMPMKDLDTLAIVDLAFDPADGAAGKALIGHCDREARRLRVEAAAAILNPASPLLPYLQRSGFLKSPEAFTLVVHTPHARTDLNLTTAEFPHWHLTWFDHDYV
jgi:hypothetical protein